MLILLEHPKHGRMHVYSEHDRDEHLKIGWSEVNEKANEKTSPKKIASEEAPPESILIWGEDAPKEYKQVDIEEPITTPKPEKKVRKLRSDEELINGEIVRKRRVAP